MREQPPDGVGIALPCLQLPEHTLLSVLVLRHRKGGQVVQGQRLVPIRLDQHG